MDIGRVCMIVEVDNTPCLVSLPQERMKILVELAASLSDTGKLPVRKPGDEYKFETIVWI